MHGVKIRILFFQHVIEGKEIKVFRMAEYIFARFQLN
jgi:hypothetical protein